MRISLDTQYERLIVERKILIDKDLENHEKSEAEGFVFRKYYDYDEENNKNNEDVPLLVLNKKDAISIIKALNFLMEFE